MLQSVDDYLNEEANKDLMYNTRRLSVPATKTDYTEYSDLMVQHSREIRNEQTKADFKPTPTYSDISHENLEGSQETFLNLRLRHDNALKKPRKTK